MNEAASYSSFYKVGGALPQDIPSYVTRKSDRQLYEALKTGEFCYVLNSRQMGKSSLMVRTLAQLQAENWAGAIVDFSAKDSQADKPAFWYNGIINQLNNNFDLLDFKSFRPWLKERNFISPVERLGEFIEMVLLPGIKSPIVILIDEIDSTLNLPFTDDFFALIRACYNKRAENPDYQRLTFALFGVAAPSDLISDAKRTPFNIGKSIDLKGFTSEEALPLARGLQGKFERPELVLQEILYWTGGQPFLTQRVCQLAIDSNLPFTSKSEAKLIENLVNSRLIENWESQDHQEHLKTIRRRLLNNEQKAGYLLELYRKIRQAGEFTAHNRPEEQELQLTGLVVKRDGKLQVYNPIYAAVFNERWIDAELNNLRPYAESFRAWIASGKTDSSRLLRGEALKDAEQWAAEKEPSAEDLDFLAACRTQQREEEIAIKEREAEITREKKARKAAETAELLQTEAYQKSQRVIRGGLIVFVVALFSTFSVIIWGFLQHQSIKIDRDTAKIELKETNDALKAIKTLTELAGELRDEGKVKAADEVLRKASLSILIDDWKLKQAWILTATAEAKMSSGGKEIETAEAKLSSGGKEIKTAEKILNQLPESNNHEHQDEKSPDHLNQVRAFTNLQAGRLAQLNSNNKNSPENSPESYYRDAYYALKESKFQPFEDEKVKTDVLNEKDVENIHYQLIESSGIDINSPKNIIAISFRQHLYDWLEFLLQKNRLQEADRKTMEIMLYITREKKEEAFKEESLKTFSCEALEEIDTLWKDYSSRPQHFGFHMQQEIWQEVGSPSVELPESENWKKFWFEVGWKDLLPKERGSGEATGEEEDKKENFPRVKEGLILENDPEFSSSMWSGEYLMNFFAERIESCLGQSNSVDGRAK